MTFSNSRASVFIPDGLAPDKALARITHLSIGAHQDDTEIMALHGILHCFARDDAWFGCVTCTDGSGSPRSGEYANFSDADMAALRRREQEKAAVVGNYGALVQLNHSSGVVKDPASPFVRDVAAVLSACRPEVLYTHNPADKHDTHVAVALAALRAVRALPAEARPRKVLGCEVWRSLDWMLDDDPGKLPLDVGAHENLAAALIGVHDSQVAGGKRYDIANWGRRRANATYFQAHATDEAEQLWFAMDLTPLVEKPELDVAAFVLAHVEAFRRDVESRIRKLSPA